MLTHYNSPSVSEKAMKFATIGLLLSALIAFPAYADPARDLFRNVMDNANLCSYGKDVATRTDCFINAAPRKCEAEARKYLATQNEELFYCVSSCANAGLASSIFGECSRSLDSKDAGQRLGALRARGEEQRRQAQEAALALYWARADKANSEALAAYVYLANPSTDLDRRAISNFEFLKRKYLTTWADSYEAVHRAARETNDWHARIKAEQDRKQVQFMRSAPITSEVADAILGSTPARGTPQNSSCQFKPSMTDADYAACGITPPGR